MMHDDEENDGDDGNDCNYEYGHDDATGGDDNAIDRIVAGSAIRGSGWNLGR